MNDVTFATACEGRFAPERACAPQSAARRSADHLALMRTEIFRQGQPGLTDEAFCASDATFHRALVDGAGNPVLSYQLAGAVEARNGAATAEGLTALEEEKQALPATVFARRAGPFFAQRARPDGGAEG